MIGYGIAINKLNGFSMVATSIQKYDQYANPYNAGINQANIFPNTYAFNFQDSMSHYQHQMSSGRQFRSIMMSLMNLMKSLIFMRPQVNNPYNNGMSNSGPGITQFTDFKTTSAAPFRKVSFKSGLYKANAPVKAISDIKSSASNNQINPKFRNEIQSASAKYGYNPNRLINAILVNSKKHNIDPNLVWSIIKQESSGNPNARSSEGARGLMQLMPATAKAVGVNNSYNIEENIAGGVAHFAYGLKKNKGNIRIALAAYNAGQGNVNKYGGIPPFKETQNYVAKIMATYRSVAKYI